MRLSHAGLPDTVQFLRVPQAIVPERKLTGVLKAFGEKLLPDCLPIWAYQARGAVGCCAYQARSAVGCCASRTRICRKNENGGGNVTFSATIFDWNFLAGIGI